MTKEQIYREQMQALGIYQEIFEPEIRTLARIERELTRAMKAWSATAPPGGKASFLDDHYAVIQKLRAELLQHRQALGLTPQAFRKLTGVNAGADAPMQQDLITAKLDELVTRVSGYDGPTDGWITIPGAEEAEAIGDRMDRENHPDGEPGDDFDLAAAVAEDMG